MVEHKDEGVLDKILTLVAPPPSAATQKGRGGGSKKLRTSSLTASIPFTNNLTVASSVRHVGIQNHPYCDGCGDGGSLLCCDTCPASFHFNCCDPPVNPKNIPSGEWLCRHCRGEPISEGVPLLFRPLVESAIGTNPRVFCIPYEMQRKDILPGSSRKELKQARLYHQIDQEQCKYCYTCNKSSSHGRMVSCDFCPLVFHLDCLQPPLTIPPTTVWMCPVHPHSKIPGFDHPRLSQRLKALEKNQADIPYHIIKADFMEQLGRIPHYKRITRHHNRRVMKVPAAVKSLYRHPLPDVSRVPSVSDSMLLPEEDVERWRMEEEVDRKTFVSPRQPALTHNQDEWTRRLLRSQLCAPSAHSSRTDARETNEEDHKPDLLPDSNSSELMAAQQLLELSAATGRTQDFRRKEGGKGGGKEGGKWPPPLMNGFVGSHSLKNDKCGSGLLNGESRTGVSGTTLCVVDEEGGEGDSKEDEEGGKMLSKAGDSSEVAMDTWGELAQSKGGDSVGVAMDTDVDSLLSGNGGLRCEVDDDSASIGAPESRWLSPSGSPSAAAGHTPVKWKEEMELGSGNNVLVPDLSQLDPKVVQLLALQRVQQLLSTRPPHETEPPQHQDTRPPQHWDTRPQQHQDTRPPLPQHQDTRPPQQQDTWPPETQHTMTLQPQDTGSDSSTGLLQDRKGVSKAGQPILNGWTRSSSPSPNTTCKDSVKGSLDTAPALLCPLSGTSLASPLHKQVTSIGLGSEADILLSEFGHCNFISSRQVCIFYDKVTQDYELINYSEHGTIVDGVLYSCDFSTAPPPDPNRDVVLTLDDLSALGKGHRASRARARLEAARKSLKDKERAKRALEAALRLSAPIKDDLSLAEEMSKCEGLMTRTGLKRVAATESGGSGGNSSVVLSIPFTKTKKSEAVNSKKGLAKIQSPSRPDGVQRTEELKRKNAVPMKEEARLISGTTAGTRMDDVGLSRPLLKEESSGVEVQCFGEAFHLSRGPDYIPCGCDRNPSSTLEFSGKGWEGTATLYHGSRLHFGCLQFILSLAGQPGHKELLQALSDQSQCDL